MEHCRTCGAKLRAGASVCHRCNTPIKQTVRDAGGLNRLRAEADGSLLNPPLPPDDVTLPDDGFHFVDGRIVYAPGSRPTATMGSVNSSSANPGITAEDNPAIALEDAPTVGAPMPAALSRLNDAEFAPPPPVDDGGETLIEQPSVRPTRGLLEPGDEVDGYLIRQEIGRGGMGRVYRAEHKVTGQEAALKMLLPQLINDARLKARFVNEAKVLARLEHDNLVRLLGFIESERRAFIVMPYVAGTTLDRRMQRQGRLSLDEALDLFRQMVDGLDHMHRHGVMHRDLKPSNVIIQADGRVKITDFGIARAVGSEKLTMDGMVVGTAEYLAPEQANGTLRDDLRSDVYSLAILLYEMLTGRVPFRHPSAAKVLIKQVSSPPPPPRTIRPEIPVGIEAALLKALAKSPTERFSSVVEFRDAVELALVQDTPTAHTPQSTVAESRATEQAAIVRRPRNLLALIVQVLIGGVIGAGIAAAIWYYAVGRT